MWMCGCGVQFVSIWGVCVYQVVCLVKKKLSIQEEAERCGRETIERGRIVYKIGLKFPNNKTTKHTQVADSIIR